MRKDMARTQEKRQRGAHRAKAEQNMDQPKGDLHSSDLKTAVVRTKDEMRRKAKAKDELKRMQSNG